MSLTGLFAPMRRREALLPLLAPFVPHGLSAATNPTQIQLSKSQPNELLIRVQPIGDRYLAYWRAGFFRGATSLRCYGANGEILWAHPGKGFLMNLVPVSDAGVCCIEAVPDRRILLFSEYDAEGAVTREVELDLPSAVLAVSAGEHAVCAVGPGPVFFWRTWGGGPCRESRPSGLFQTPEPQGNIPAAGVLGLLRNGSEWVLLDRVEARVASIDASFANARSSRLTHSRIQEALQAKERRLESLRKDMEAAGRKDVALGQPTSIIYAASDYKGGIWIVPSPLNPRQVTLLRVDAVRHAVTETMTLELPLPQDTGQQPPTIFSSAPGVLVFAYRNGLVARYSV